MGLSRNSSERQVGTSKSLPSQNRAAAGTLTDVARCCPLVTHPDP